MWNMNDELRALTDELRNSEDAAVALLRRKLKARSGATKSRASQGNSRNPELTLVSDRLRTPAARRRSRPSAVRSPKQVPNAPGWVGVGRRERRSLLII